MKNIETLHQLLKRQTMVLHEKAHQIPYISNLLKNNVEVESYVGHLRALAIVYGTLERQLSTLKQHEITHFLEGYTPKLQLLLADLEYFNAKEIKDIIPAISNALQVADKILMYSEKSPYKLVGFLYTLDGSLNGGSVFKMHLTERFGLQNGHGISYFSSYNGQFKQFWEKFTDKLNIEITDNQIKEDVLSAATEIFNDLMNIYERLFPFDEKQLGNHVTSLNPEAGNFPIPTNPLEIEAAITAGMKCWNEFPFYEKRYGERGKRFTVSDSAWLVTLSDLSADMATDQVIWLTKYLANRGMPGITMEFHLKYLYQELAKQVPENEPKYTTLLLVSEHLKNQRIEMVSSALFEKCNSLFENFCLDLNVSDVPLKNTGILIASSVADGRSGMIEAMQNFKTWITTPEKFSDRWIQAIEKTYSALDNQI